MGDNTARANLYLPGGGSSGLITPPEQVDIDKINDNMRKVDLLLGALPVTSTTRPTGPMDGQLIYETDTRNTLIYRLSETAWRPVGSPNCPSEAYRNAIFPASPAPGDSCYRIDRHWTETYYPATSVTVAGWYPVSGNLPRIDFQQNGSLVTFGGGAWTAIRSSWNWAAAKQINVSGVLSYEADGSFKTLIPGFFEFEYNMDLNIASGAIILAISAHTTTAHAFADDRAIASATFPEASNRVGGKVSTGPILMDANKYVQGNIFPDINGTLDAARKTTNFVSARYVGPPFKP